MLTLNYGIDYYVIRSWDCEGWWRWLEVKDGGVLMLCLALEAKVSNLY